MHAVIAWEPAGENTRLDPFDFATYEYLITEGPRRERVAKPKGPGWVQLDTVFHRCPPHDSTWLALWRRTR